MFEEAVKLLKKMEYSAIEPDVYSYNELLKAHCKANHPDKAYLFMVPKGFCDVVSYNTIIKAFCSISNNRRAYKLFEEMGRKGIAPDVVTFTILIKAFLREAQ
ncbi:hypothetical protein POTOM_026552 [Populus tomentosa]|uniref:Pentatricopeptide repeat-containing protein n=1 Tax=Populus tomentosa TaxID=118781 RepID=A0A8X7ZR46_POPTO|nr:hypothetical protein POTOM_026552 [Populus tomentosa]